MTVCPVNSKGLSTSTGRNSAPGKAVSSPLLLQFVPPSTDLLPCHIMPLRNLRHRRAAHADRQNKLELLLVAPPSPTLQPKNIASHHLTRIRYAVNDIVMHVP